MAKFSRHRHPSRFEEAPYLQVVGGVRWQAGGSVVLQRSGGCRKLWGDWGGDGLRFRRTLWGDSRSLTRTWRTWITLSMSRRQTSLFIYFFLTYLAGCFFCIFFVWRTMSLKLPSTAAVMMPRKRATMLRMVADHNRWWRCTTSWQLFTSVYSW